MTFEFRQGVVQVGHQRFIGSGAVRGPEVQFVGRANGVGHSLGLDVEFCRMGGAWYGAIPT